MADPSIHLNRYRILARAMDARFRIPGTPVRFGWDAIMGIVPGIGDALGSLIGGYGLYVGTRLGTPLSVLIRMLLNLTLDLALGAIPVAGDLFDVAWRGNLRNLALLEGWMARPHQVHRSSTALLWGLGAILLGLAVLAGWVGFRLAVWVLSPLR